MVVVKSDAMLLHEKWIAEVVAHRPKHANNKVMHIEVRNYVIAAAIIGVIVIAVLEMIH